MGMFNQSKSTQTITSSNLATQLQTSLNNNASKLQNRKEQALSTFRSTVKNLLTINEGLRSDVALADEMIAVCTARKAEAELAIKDNEAICRHILDIIGETEDGMNKTENKEN